MLNKKTLKLNNKNINYWSNVLNSSAPGTLAYSEATFALKHFKNLKTNSKNISLENLSEENLEIISGGKNNNFNKKLSTALALTVVAFPFATAKPTVTNNLKNKSIYAGEKFKQFYKEHPTISKCALAASALTTAILSITGGVILLDKLLLSNDKHAEAIHQTFSENLKPKEITTLVDRFSDEEVKEQLKIQIEIYKSRDPEIFKVEDELIQKAHPRTLLIVMMRLNNLFNKYKGFTQEFIKQKRKERGSEEYKEFYIKLMDNNSSGLASANYLAFKFSEKFICKFEESLSDAKENVECGFRSYVTSDLLIDGIMAHEFGHLMEKIYYFKCTIESSSFLGREDYIKAQILKTARENYNNTNEKISRYGEMSSEEFFAEAFAHLECGGENINPIGLATRDYIENWFA